MFILPENLKEEKNDNKRFNAAIKMDKRCNNKAEEGPLGNIRENSEKGFRAAEGGQKPKYLVPEIRVALLEWFVAV